MLARVDPTLDRPVILFQDVIEILHGAVLAVVGQIACGLEYGNGWRISSVLVGVDDPWLRMVLSTLLVRSLSAAYSNPDLTDDEYR